MVLSRRNVLDQRIRHRKCSVGGLLAQTGVVLAHHFTGTDPVDGCEIRWEDETQYDTAREHAQDEWHSLRGDDDCVEILEDEWNTISDLEWLDIDDDSVIWAGRYFQVWGATTSS